MKKLAKIWSPLLLLVVAVPMFICFKDGVIINVGIEMYRMLAWVSVSITVMYVIVAAVASVKVIRQGDDEEEDAALTDDKKEEIEREFMSLYKSKWTKLKGVPSVKEMLDSIDKYQDSIQYILAQQTYLSDKPVQIIQRIEDCIYINLKKLTNYMRVLQPKDIGMLQYKMDECLQKNSELLQKCRDFVVAATDYVNRDLTSAVSEQEALDHVNSYMYVVLDAIEKQDIYLT